MSEYTTKRIQELFGEGQLYCAETVLTVIAESGGKDASDLVRMATGFCSGASRTCGQCGAVSGAIMGIGLFAGREKPGGDYEPAYELTQEFLKRFNAKFHSINCETLTGCDLSTDGGREKFKENKVIHDCVGFSEFAVETALELLREDGYVKDFEEQVESMVAPCGLTCGKCLAFKGGRVQELSQGLKKELGDNFKAYAQRFEAMNPIFKSFSDFDIFLTFMSEGSCTGCRDKGCLFESCIVPTCAKDHGVKFCHECSEFPCDKHGMPKELAARCQRNNEKIRDEGLAAWYDLCLRAPRYP